MKKVLVTGANGMLGQAITDACDVTRYELIGYDIVNNQDIRVREQFAECIRRNRPTHCIHLAAEANVYHAQKRPIHAQTVNVEGTENVAEVCATFGVKLIFASTVCIYGNNGEHTQCESSPINPTEIYASTKKESEAILSQIPQLDYRILRLATFYGPQMRKDLVLDRILTAINNGTKFQIHGNGEQTRSYTHVKDIARSFFTILDKWPKELIYNVASNKAFSVLQLIAICEHVTGEKLHVEYTQERPGQILQSRTNCNRLKKYGWKPSEDLYDGVQECWLSKYKYI